MTNNATPYELLGKEEGIKALADAFYDAMDELPNAQHIREMHNKSLTDIKQKLFEYLNGWLGGPHLYKEKYGHICLTDQHKAFTITEEDRDQWLFCWHHALDKLGIADDVKTMIEAPINRMADFLVNKR